MMFGYPVDAYPIGIALILGSSLFAVLAFRLFRKAVPIARLTAIQEPGGTFFQVIGTLYAVLLGLIVLDAISRYMDAEKAISSEAGALVAIYSLADQISTEHRKLEIREMTEAYLEEILRGDWAHMEEGTENYLARRKLRSLSNAVKSIEPVTENDKVVVPVLLDKMLDATDLRRFRIDQCKTGIPGSEWFFLFFGTLATLVSSFFYRVENRAAHELGILMMSLVMATNLYMVLLFGEPYKGAFIASRQPLLTAMTIMNGTYFGPDDSAEINDQEAAPPEIRRPRK